jgi:hypothetical protein
MKAKFGLRVVGLSLPWEHVIPNIWVFSLPWEMVLARFSIIARNLEDHDD